MLPPSEHSIRILIHPSQHHLWNVYSLANTAIPPSCRLFIAPHLDQVHQYSSIWCVDCETGKSRNGEYARCECLKGLTGPQTIFVYPGTYSEQLRINYPDSTGNVINSFGTGTDTQALALASTGQKQVFKYCTFSSFQDTVQVSGVSYFYGCRIEGAVDFIFGPGSAWFESVVVAIKASPTPVITAQKNSPGGHTSIVINKSQVISAGAKPDSAYLGRPWSEDATVVFQSCSLGDVIKPEGWRAWNPPSDPRTAHATFQEYKNFGAGANTSARQIGTQRSSPVDIADVLGSDHGTWAK
ncbi:hypothetical protein H4Q26_004884 [Puccinia striiformis f. sp. tritici PST-130]|nr:hypothetical protein H4Q26_004884 [Puccinia striiformis f. sp. tritici PST-130]